MPCVGLTGSGVVFHFTTIWHATLASTLYEFMYCLEQWLKWVQEYVQISMGPVSHVPFLLSL